MNEQMNSESIQLAQELKKSINSDIYKTGPETTNSENNSGPENDNIKEIEKKYLSILGSIYKSAEAILSGKKYTIIPTFPESSVRTQEIASKFFNHLRDIVLNIDEEDKLEYKNALENYFRIFPWIIRNELELS